MENVCFSDTTDTEKATKEAVWRTVRTTELVICVRSFSVNNHNVWPLCR